MRECAKICEGGGQAPLTDFSTLPQVIPTSIPISIPNLSDFFDVVQPSCQNELSKTNGPPPPCLDLVEAWGPPCHVYRNPGLRTQAWKNKKTFFFPKFFDYFSNFFDFGWGAAPQTPRFLAGGAKPPQTPRPKRSSAAFDRGRQTGPPQSNAKIRRRAAPTRIPPSPSDWTLVPGTTEEWFGRGGIHRCGGTTEIWH